MIMAGGVCGKWTSCGNAVEIWWNFRAYRYDGFYYRFLEGGGVMAGAGMSNA